MTFQPDGKNKMVYIQFNIGGTIIECESKRENEGLLRIDQPLNAKIKSINWDGEIYGIEFELLLTAS